MNLTYTIKSFTSCAVSLLAGSFLMVSVAAAQNIPQANNDIQGCRNGAAASPQQCVDGNWVNGNAGQSNSHWAETQFVAYRGGATGLTVGTSYSFTIGYDILKNGKHAIDYLGTFNATETTADPCHDVGCTLASPTSTIAVPTDTVTVTNNINPFTHLPIIQQPGVITMWGGQLTAVSYVPYDGSEHRALTLTFTATSTSMEFAFGGHIAWGGDWGVGNSAGSIPGSPYHTNFDACDFSCTTHENSLSTDAVVIGGIVRIVKQVSTADGSNVAITLFGFTSSANFGVTAFNVKADGVAGDDTRESSAIIAFGAANTITVSENTINGWTLANIACTETGTQNSTTNLAQRTATIVVEEGEAVTCTFTNTQLGVTAAPASISGQVVSATGMPLRGVTVSLTDASTGERRIATTSSFGYFVFDNCMTDDFYVINLKSRTNTFSPSSRSFTLTDNLAGMDFVADP
jgi:hypothetical protein